VELVAVRDIDSGMAKTAAGAFAREWGVSDALDLDAIEALAKRSH
jgi:hypothetical protein